MTRNAANARTLSFRTFLGALQARNREIYSGRHLGGIRVSPDGWFYYRSWPA